ncbi:hypothetical protein A3K48_07885 [candidate division WOR-1 bacterium RIFOXYA12_FULL_52_29]|uniref:Uncharacterized protein n=1 Tax=candidate division WOR-1 bacterium RIFOXYC12_FULL_54_18 TaxID=1802584 RepID=A0A1F4T811_UNCSA|nr:MAG: hypothetical protein A3K44_07885 [candidate division WOR-1 bacterium RIFOXYA2_FULL_51_19]OGC18431.1 MAG: hypothetical protein A3K48_07885 [candidate division WOR-1 bacterium RIFOXYA12_FULL_52_29]OGC27285.1 MAG: hypothetical protein A3K32_07880 [candidate division WOR-1 bacterium RIFOXYB2_FULL_45_9]OGC28848.1 MAG: hypothetical protein A3K49_07885 [candidate division WOR-1 bacterium RIFOXYC12_FULL_54_18]OGC30643.1 MAG: hypothetical protein A2346_00090 [candidate division WOR-1 bacterium R
MKEDIIIVANSPGELSAMVKPVVDELAKETNKRIFLILTPCQYNSGRELEFAKTLKGIEAIVTADQYKKWAFMNKPPRGLTFAKKGAVIYLGGDLAHAMIVARKLHYPAFAYVQDRVGWKKAYQKFFVPDQQVFDKFKKQLSAKKLEIVGNLMVDSVNSLGKWSPEDKVVTFMPGSRHWEIDYMTPFYKEVINMLRSEDPAIKFQLVSSPFIKATPISGVKTVSFDDIANSELVVTIPGTNTAKIAARGIPMLVVFPLNNPEVIPLDGLADILCRVPVAGPAFKRWLAKTINKKTKFFALPNQKAGKEVAPEMRGELEPLGVAMKALELLRDKPRRVKMSAALSAAMGEPGGAKRLVEKINAAL